MIRAVIIDDEPKNIRILSKLLEEFCPNVAIVGDASNPEKAIPLLESEKPDLVFLDIEMPYGNAFDLLDRIRPVNFELIFVTAFSEYSLKAFRYSALDYLLKPVSIEELKEAVRKAEERLEHKNINQQLNNLLHNLSRKKPEQQRIAFTDKDGSLVFIEIQDIIRLEAQRGYTYVHTANRPPILSTKSIKEYEAILPEDIFYRIHHSHIINFNQMSKYHRGRGGFVEMNDGENIEVAIRRKDGFLARLSQA